MHLGRFRAGVDCFRGKIERAEIELRLYQHFLGFKNLRVVLDGGPYPSLLVVISDGYFFLDQLPDLRGKIAEVFRIVMRELVFKGIKFTLGKFVIFLRDSSLLVS